MRHTYLIYVLSVVMYVATLGSCAMAGEESFADDREPAIGEMVEISLGVPSLSVATRTSIESDNGNTAGSSLTARWDAGDSFGLLVRRSGSSTVAIDENLFGNAFSFTHAGNDHDLKNELFTGRMPHIPQGYTYNYYAIYPYSAITGVNDTTVSCTIPTVQSGVYDGGADLMFASVQGDALDPNLYNNLDFEFKHLTHALKITVPEELNEFGYDIERIAIEFPQPVAGEAVLDCTTGELVSTLKSDIIEIRFSKENPFEEGKPFWVYTAPVELNGAVRFTAYNDTEGAMSDYVQTTELTKLEPKHITPISLKVKEGYQVTWFDYTVDGLSQLGEEVDVMTLKLSGDCMFAARNNEMTVTKNDNGKFSFPFRTAELASWTGSSNIEMTPIYESEHAIVSEHADILTISATDYNPNQRNDRSVVAPYLFYEDFATVENTNNNDSTDTGNGGSVTATYFLNNTWSGARFGASAGVGIRLAAHCRYFIGTYINPARLDSAPFSQLKDNATVSVSLQFDYGMNQASAGSLTSGQVNQTCYIGRSETYGLPSTDESGEFFDSFDVNKNDGSYTNLTDHYNSASNNKYMTDCRKTSRICLRTVPDTPGYASNRTCWLYIDNIKVSIAQ